jgi:drug/metabolite transporter (DMT)-like permease
VNLFHTAFWVFVPLTLIMPFVWEPMSLRVFGAMLVVGIWGLSVLYLLDRALAYAPASVAAPFIFTVPLWGCLEAAFRSGARMQVSRWMGAMLIGGSCAFLFVREARRSAQRVDTRTPIE